MKNLYLVFGMTILGLYSQAQSSMTWFNQSDYTIDEIYISMIDTKIWGANLLDKPLLPGSSARLLYPYCEDYNIKLINSQGDECFIEQQYLCTDLVNFLSDDWIECFGESEQEGE